jgi:hypothetical protein
VSASSEKQDGGTKLSKKVFEQEKRNGKMSNHFNSKNTLQNIWQVGQYIQYKQTSYKGFRNIKFFTNLRNLLAFKATQTENEN